MSIVTWWRFWERRTPEPEPVRNQTTYSIGDPALAAWIAGGPTLAGVEVTESTSLGLSAVWRAVSLISGTVASLPLRTVREVDGVRTEMRSFLDNPGGDDGPTPFEWKETALVHLLLHGNAFARHIFNQAGGIAALELIHPLLVSVEKWTPITGRPRPRGGKWFRVTLDSGVTVELDADTMTHIPAMATDPNGRGLSPIAVARNSLGTAVAGDRAAAKLFSNGAFISGMATPEDPEGITPDEAVVAKDAINRAVAGWENAGSIAVLNHKMNFESWAMSAVDAQFLQSRQFSVEEIARWFGVPPHALMQTEKQTSWGTGVAEQNRGLSRTVLAPWANRIEQRLSRLLPAPRKVVLDFAALERPTPEMEVDTLIKKVEAGLMTPNEARQVLNLEPVDGGNELRGTTPPAEPAPAEGDPADDREPVDA